jgi:hypothetical protein
MKLLIEGSAPWCAQFVFKYGLVRPPSMLQYYSSVADLVAEFESYKPAPRKKRAKQNIPMRFRVIQESEFRTEIVQTLLQSGVPFDKLLDVVIEYTGTGIMIFSSHCI